MKIVITTKGFNVYSGKHIEGPTKMVARKVSHEEALRLLDAIPTIKGNEPYAMSCKSFGGLFPKIDRNGNFIGFHPNREDEHLPFKV